MDMPNLHNFILNFNAVFAYSSKNIDSFRRFDGVKSPPKQDSKTRWFRWYQLIVSIWDNFNHLIAWFSAKHYSKDSISGTKVFVHLNNYEKYITLLAQMHQCIYVGRRLVQTCYLLEGDGFLAHLAYNKMITVCEYLQAIRDNISPYGQYILDNCFLCQAKKDKILAELKKMTHAVADYVRQSLANDTALNRYIYFCYFIVV